MRLALFLLTAVVAFAQKSAPVERAAKPIARAIVVAQPAAQTPAPIQRAALQELEKSTDSAIESTVQDDRFFLLGATRGVYVKGYGAVFTTEVDIAPSSAPNPFRPAFTKDEIAKLRDKKRTRIALLKERMREILNTYANTLKSLSPDEHLAFAITVPYYSWEDSSGLPRQILLTATRRDIAQPKLQEFF